MYLQPVQEPVKDRIQFHEDEETLAFVESLGLDPDALARRAFQREVRRLRAEKRHQRLEEAQIRLPRSAAEVVREDRDR